MTQSSPFHCHERMVPDESAMAIVEQPHRGVLDQVAILFPLVMGAVEGEGHVAGTSVTFFPL